MSSRVPSQTAASGILFTHLPLMCQELVEKIRARDRQPCGVLTAGFIACVYEVLHTEHCKVSVDSPGSVCLVEHWLGLSHLWTDVCMVFLGWRVIWLPTQW